ncbi:hypothetical protein QVD17_19668 [Tagetes erecta]|uniref:PUB 12/19-like N-terminal domain-containing protein n=1 Tax=Tagetes erecta TaxID=13708 RepID=A0AAD8KN38_TARER|nr:hypothetical protein QVD17_19668 [Tagetes erecta]
MVAIGASWLAAIVQCCMLCIVGAPLGLTFGSALNWGVKKWNYYRCKLEASMVEERIRQGSGQKELIALIQNPAPLKFKKNPGVTNFLYNCLLDSFYHNLTPEELTRVHEYNFDHSADLLLEKVWIERIFTLFGHTLHFNDGRVVSNFVSQIKWESFNYCNIFVYDDDQYVEIDEAAMKIASHFHGVTWKLEKALSNMLYDSFDISDEVQEQKTDVKSERTKPLNSTPVKVGGVDCGGCH